MKKIKSGKSIITLTTGLILSFATTCASATEYVSTAPWESWAGIYFGTYFGAGSGDTDQTFNERIRQRQIIATTTQIGIITSDERGSGKLSGDITGSKADLFVGYNFNPECANYVLSGQLEGTFFSDITLKSIGTNRATFVQTQTLFSGGATLTSIASGHSTETDESTDELRSMFSFVARAGYLVTPPVLIYALIGATEGNFVIPDNDDPFGGKRNKWELGYTFGAGVEYKLNEHWFIRGEYRYLHFDIDRSESNPNITTQFSTSTLVFSSAFSRNSSTDFDFNLGQIGIVYRF